MPMKTIDNTNMENCAPPANIVIFGATGDLTRRKLIPALLKMLECNLMDKRGRIIGVVRKLSFDEWVDKIHSGLKEFSADSDLIEQQWPVLKDMLKMVSGDLSEADTYQQISQSLETIDGQKNTLFYLAIPPSWYVDVASSLSQAGLNDETEGYRRIVIEKPFGMNLETSRELNLQLQASFNENQIYRIDHYLGKESVQNLLVYRFTNSILEPLWNRNYIDHIQISAAESIGIEYRADYYEHAGALRDMIQSHLMQVMTLVAMEPPVEFTADAVRDEKMKVLRAIRRFEPEQVEQLTVAAQYASGKVNEEKVPAYVSEPNVSPDSATETFSAVKFHIDNWRWQGVPFILWTGKRMQKRASEIVIRFRKPPFNLFDSEGSIPTANALVFRLHPDEGIVLRMNAKKPGLTTEIQRMVMRAPYADNGNDVADAYEILLHDVLMGDATLFSRADEVEESWAIVEPILDAWKDRFSIERYRAGTWDIPDMDKLLAGCVGGWHQPT